jgi:hypothetical protein
MFEKIKKWYIQGLWSDTMVQNARARGILTHEQVTEILAC